MTSPHPSLPVQQAGFERRGIFSGGWWPISGWWLVVFIFLLPWQARWMWQPRALNGALWEYGSFSFYATEVLLWVALLAATGNLLRQRDWRILSPFSWRRLGSSRGVVFIASLLLLGSAWASIWYALDRPLALQAAFRLSEALALLYVLFLVAPAARSAARAALAVAAGLQSALALTQFFSQTIRGSTFAGVDPQSAGELGASVLELADGRWLRAYGTFPHPNILAGFLVFGLLFAAAWYREREHGWSRMAAIVCGLFAGLGLAVTFSRAAALALVAALAGWGMVASGIERRILVRFFSRVAVVVVLLAVMLSPLVFLRLSGQGRLEVKSLTERQALGRQTWQLARFSWWRGVGAGNSTLAAFRHNPRLPGWTYQPVHRVGLLVLLELGFAGLAALVAWLAGLLVLGISTRQGTLIAVTVALITLGVTDHYLWSLYPGLMMAAVGLGLARVVPRPT